jgi:hypothetical protein
LIRGEEMRRLVIIGKYLKGKKTMIIDLRAYKESMQKQNIKESNNPPSEEKTDQKVPMDT